MSEPSGFAINLIRTGDAGSAFRVQNSPGEFQRQHLVDRGSEFSVQGDLLLVIHGQFAPGGDPATLIVVEFRFLSCDHDRRFREATIEFLFAESFDPKSDYFRDPEVVRIAPTGKCSLNPTREEWSSKRTTSASGEAGAGAHAKLGATVSLEISRSCEKEYWAIVNGISRIEGRNRGPKNEARWCLLENASRRDGIPSLLRSAILIKRKDDSHFVATIKIKSKVDKLHSARGWLEDLLGKTPKDDPIFFDPKCAPLGDIPLDIDVDDLSSYDLAKLAAAKSTTPI